MICSMWPSSLLLITETVNSTHISLSNIHYIMKRHWMQNTHKYTHTLTNNNKTCHLLTKFPWSANRKQRNKQQKLTNPPLSPLPTDLHSKFKKMQLEYVLSVALLASGKHFQVTGIYQHVQPSVCYHHTKARKIQLEQFLRNECPRVPEHNHLPCSHMHKPKSKNSKLNLCTCEQ